ncbi:MAG: hypothetical protein RLZZ468_269 [Cyanobacteriota bacterium]|jgi:hypothetical protein
MSFDPRSLERLRELGRNLPQPLPAPQPPATRAKAEPKRHRVETEQNPEQLFRELMQASPDGSVPEHLLQRLRQLEDDRHQARPLAAPAGGGAPAAAGSGGLEPGRIRPERRQRRSSGGNRPDPRLGGEQAELYTAFQQLLLEDDD